MITDRRAKYEAAYPFYKGHSRVWESRSQRRPYSGERQYIRALCDDDTALPITCAQIPPRFSWPWPGPPTYLHGRSALGTWRFQNW